VVSATRNARSAVLRAALVWDTLAYAITPEPTTEPRAPKKIRPQTST